MRPRRPSSTAPDNEADFNGGGIYNHTTQLLTVKNCILWGNSAGSGTIAQQQLHNNGAATVTYTDLQQATGVFFGDGNINLDPQFVDPDSGDYDLASNSPCIDRAEGDDLVNTYIDTFDLNMDGDQAEPTPDLRLDCRVVDDPNETNRGGTGEYPYADMGAYEYQIGALPPCDADIAPPGSGNCLDDGDGGVGAPDLGELLANWGTPDNLCADIAPPGNLDGIVNAADLGQLLANWGMCERIRCDFGGSFAGGGGGESSGGFGEQDWPAVEMTEELYDWIMSSALDDIIEWLWSLLED
jgi:hypothetical protein